MAPGETPITVRREAGHPLRVGTLDADLECGRGHRFGEGVGKLLLGRDEANDGVSVVDRAKYETDPDADVARPAGD